MSCGIYGINCAVYKALNDDTELNNDLNLGNRIYDHVPQTAKYPFVAIGRVDSTGNLTFDESGDDMIYNVDLFGKAKTFANYYQIADRIKAILDRNDTGLSSEACCIQSILYDGMTVNPLKDMEIEGRQLTVEFRIKTL